MYNMIKQKKIILIILSIFFLTLISFLIILFTIIIPERKEKEYFEEQVKLYYENKLKLYEEENEKFEDYEIDVAFIGDSLTDAYDLEKYYPEFVVSNRGIGGETTIGLEKRMQVSVYDLKPKVVVMLIGANNMDSMFNNYENLLIGLSENLPNTKVVLLSLTAMGDNWGRKNQLAAFNNVKIRKLAEKYNYHFIDLYTPLLDVTTNEVYDGYTIDGGHFTELGYDVVTNLIKPVLIEILTIYPNYN